MLKFTHPCSPRSGIRSFIDLLSVHPLHFIEHGKERKGKEMGGGILAVEARNGCAAGYLVPGLEFWETNGPLPERVFQWEQKHHM